MWHLLLVMFLIFMPFRNVKAQDSLPQKFSIHVGMTRMDFFTGISYSRQIKLFSPYVSFQTGINRTFFQSRFFPRLTVGTTYHVFQKGKFQIAPCISYSYSILNINKKVTDFHQWNEVYTGVKWSVGEKWRFTNTIQGGWINERYNSQLTSRKIGANSTGFYTEIGIVYAF